jgi:exportin-2 (importin alpha re-exporter)
MRVIVTAQQTLTSTFEETLHRLVAILGVTSKNPSNPKFDQYIFESISGLMRYFSVDASALVLIFNHRFIVQGTPTTLNTFEQALFGPFTIILQQDIDRVFFCIIYVPALTSFL